MQSEEFQTLTRLLAKESIRDLVFDYSTAVADKDMELMSSLFVDDADFGSYGKGPDALKDLMKETMGNLEMGIILITNHRIKFVDDVRAEGEVWARCFAQNTNEGYYEQVIKYVDTYRRTSVDNSGVGIWKFETRKHLLWFGEGKESPLLQNEANWPSKNIGVGRIPLADPDVQEFRDNI
tara:strand:- start:146 stop:685 length:540 start_codon:yes stop_codon:yes gene_type:complete